LKRRGNGSRSSLSTVRHHTHAHAHPHTHTHTHTPTHSACFRLLSTFEDLEWWVHTTGGRLHCKDEAVRKWLDDGTAGALRDMADEAVGRKKRKRVID
jgi:hypothetical protein